MLEDKFVKDFQLKQHYIQKQHFKNQLLLNPYMVKLQSINAIKIMKIEYKLK